MANSCAICDGFLVELQAEASKHLDDRHDFAVTLLERMRMLVHEKFELWEQIISAVPSQGGHC